MGRSLFRSRGASFMNAWTCAAVMSVATIGACAFTEDAMSITKIPITSLRMRWLLSFAVVVSKRSVCCRRITHSGALQLARHSPKMGSQSNQSAGVEGANLASAKSTSGNVGDSKGKFPIILAGSIAIGKPPQDAFPIGSEHEDSFFRDLNCCMGILGGMRSAISCTDFSEATAGEASVLRFGILARPSERSCTQKT